MSGVKIASLELENVKRVRAVSLEPAPEGLTVIGGGNGQGKTSVLDAIAWALGGERMRPDRPTRDGSATPAHLKVELSNGLVVERKGSKGALTVTDPEGKRAGQMLLNQFIEALALDLPKFMAMSDREKADEMLKVAGIGDELADLDRELAEKSAERLAVGQEARAKRKVAEDAPYFDDAPSEPVTATELIREQQAILARNGENQKKRERAHEIEVNLESVRNAYDANIAKRDAIIAKRDALQQQIDAANDIAKKLESKITEISSDLDTARKTAEQLEDESTEEIERKLTEIDAINERVRANRRRADMEAEAEAAAGRYSALNAAVEEVKRERAKLLDGADLPLPGLTVEDGKLMYRGATWGDMSAAEQLRVATAVVRRLKPECGFVLVDKLEQMDAGTLAEFGAWAEVHGLQVIGTRVAADDTCTVVIEDGRVAGEVPPAPEAKAFTEGVF